MQIKKIFFAFLLGSAFCVSGENFQIKYNGGENWTLVERTDLRRYENGRYVGLTSREVRSFIYGTEAPSKCEGTASAYDKWYDGNFYVMEETRRALNDVGSGIHDSIPSVFHVTSNGQLVMDVDNGYPSFRSFPSYSDKKLAPGERWQSQAMRAVDPLNKGIITKMPMQVEYTFVGKEQYHGEDVFRLTAQWATRYGKTYIDFGGDKELKEAQGSHKASILVSVRSGNAVLVHDTVDETFVYSDGKQINFKGTINLFTEYPPAIDEGSILPALQRVAKLSDADVKNLSKPVNSSEFLPGKPVATSVGAGGKNNDISKNDGNIGKTGNSEKIKGISGNGLANSASKGEEEKSISVDRTSAGLRLTIKNLQFKPDSDELLPGEEKRLDDIASVLKQAPKSQFLVEGHTASTGKPAGEKELSERRAKAIAKALASRGIESGKFICKGSGGEKPVADNSTSEGKAKNRRVEITILE